MPTLLTKATGISLKENSVTFNNPTIKAFQDLSILELYAILQARCEVFTVEQRCAYQDLDDYDQDSFHIVIPFKGKLGAYCRVIPPCVKYSEWSIGRVLTVQSARGKKLAHTLTSAALDLIKDQGGGPCRISAQAYLQKFYESHGFIRIGEEYIEADIPHIEMVRSASPRRVPLSQAPSRVSI